MRSSPTSFFGLPGQCTSATARNLCDPPASSCVDTHTNAHSTLSCRSCCWARVKEFCARVILVPRASPSARVTHIPQNSRTNSLLCYVHVLRATHDQLIEHMYRQRPERNRIVYRNWNGTEGHSPHTYPFLTVCPVHVCVCAHRRAFFLISICLCFVACYVHSLISPTFRDSHGLGSIQILCKVQIPSMPKACQHLCQSPIQICYRIFIANVELNHNIQ